MKAAVLPAFGSPLAVGTLPDPELGTGEIIVDVAACRVLTYAGEVYGGERQYLMELPLAPGTGAIARVRAVGPDATHLNAGDWVYCDPTVRSRDDVLAPDICLQGLTADGEGGLRLMRHFRHGAFAEQMMVPTENAIAIGAIDETDAAKWCALGTMLVPYGGLDAVHLKAGETVLVNGATGSFGSAGVAVALAMGAGAVIATGRNAAALEDLARRFDRRLTTVQMQGDEDSDRARILAAAPAPIDCVLDLLPPMASAAQVRTAVLTVRRGGRVVLMGGLRTGFDLPYSWVMRNNVTIRGQWMYEPAAIHRMVGLIRSGLIDLDQFDATVFDLDHVNDAIAHAAANGGPFRMTVVRP